MPGLMEITLWLPIHTDPLTNTLWWKKRRTGALPDARDGVVLFMNEDPGDDPQDGPMLEPQRRYMDTDGNWHVQLQRVILKPTQDLWDQLRHERSHYLGGRECHEWFPWWTEKEADRNLTQMVEQGWRIWT